MIFPFFSRMEEQGDFIAFSSSSTPREERFQPRRGKRNRQDNWQRFGQFEQRPPRFFSPQNQRGGGPSPHFYSNSTPNWTQGPRMKNWQGSPNHFNRGRGRGGGRGRNSFNGGKDNRSYFHPSMLEDPWAPLQNKAAENTTLQDSTLQSNEASFSDSLRVQVGDSILNPAPDVGSDEEDANDESTSTALSDSLIPMVGDSILERNSEPDEN